MNRAETTTLTPEKLRQWLMTLAVALLFLATLGPPSQAQPPEQQPRPIVIEGTGTVYNTSRLMEAQVYYRTGTATGWLAEANAHRRAILEATAAQQLLEVPGLVVDKTMFTTALRYNPQLLTAMQNAITNRCMVAVDAHRFGVKGQKMAAGQPMQLTITAVAGKKGRLDKLDEPLLIPCHNWDVLHYNSLKRFYADFNPDLYQLYMGITWHPDELHFTGPDGTVLNELPKTTLSFQP